MLFKPEFLEEIEQTMLLLAFPSDDLMDFKQRQKTASEINSAILESQNQEKGSLLFFLTIFFFLEKY